VADSDGAVPDSIPANERTEIGNNFANSAWVKSILVRRDAKLAFSAVLVTVPDRTSRKPTALVERFALATFIGLRTAFRLDAVPVIDVFLFH
jgi:hypothetical protein